MIRYKAKNKYWQGGRRWHPLSSIPKTINDLHWEANNYILGDKIYTEPSEEAARAFEQVKLWMTIKK